MNWNQSYLRRRYTLLLFVVGIFAMLLMVVVGFAMSSVYLQVQQWFFLMILFPSMYQLYRERRATAAHLRRYWSIWLGACCLLLLVCAQVLAVACPSLSDEDGSQMCWQRPLARLQARFFGRDAALLQVEQTPLLLASTRSESQNLVGVSAKQLLIKIKGFPVNEPQRLCALREANHAL
ncbi:hypothetical protein [Polycladidibacter hongkongensis]|uniref:hypothetical protein n=1 Tax=Polycladidibacter hongkongensis TaxID=1647556 RepID=UPI000832406F|nr:hypothetical protein [Pseudovibrio hongkongensis]